VIDGELMPQGKILDLKGCSGAEQTGDGAQEASDPSHGV